MTYEYESTIFSVLLVVESKDKVDQEDVESIPFRPSLEFSEARSRDIDSRLRRPCINPLLGLHLNLRSRM
jgi:hypothetical protein